MTHTRPPDPQSRGKRDSIPAKFPPLSLLTSAACDEVGSYGPAPHSGFQCDIGFRGFIKPTTRELYSRDRAPQAVTKQQIKTKSKRESLNRQWIQKWAGNGDERSPRNVEGARGSLNLQEAPPTAGGGERGLSPGGRGRGRAPPSGGVGRYVGTVTSCTPVGAPRRSSTHPRFGGGRFFFFPPFLFEFLDVPPPPPPLPRDELSAPRTTPLASSSTASATSRKRAQSTKS